MHGLVNRALECFLRDTYGPQVWQGVAAAADLGFDSFEAMLVYDEGLTERVIRAAEAKLGKGRDAILEDLGTYLVSHERYERLRRLMRFGGDTFEEFLLSLDELPDRARMALPDLTLPEITVEPERRDSFLLRCRDAWPGFSSVVAGVVRAMADDYGALTTLETRAADRDGYTHLSIAVHEARFTEGRAFVLSAAAT